MRVAAYARVSTTRQAENDLSIPDQLRQMHEWCEANGHVLIREYIESGASATTDKRPLFQQMIADATTKPTPYDIILVHSHSRFFRDACEYGYYEKKLRKHETRVVSLTQPTADDAAGQMMRQIISSFDEYSSKETAKHVSRSMKENARQGYFNGGPPPYGYDAVCTDTNATRGRRKKRLVINEAEALIVREVYALYENGYKGQHMGLKEIVKHLTAKGSRMRKGKPWTTQKVHVLLSDTLYKGDHYFNVRDSRTGKVRPESEWIKATIPPIVDADTFERVSHKRKLQSPKVTHPCIMVSPRLLSGFLKCSCGHSMTTVTGKGGQYRYYKCTRRNNQNNKLCDSPNLPAEKMDDFIRTQLAEKLLTPERLKSLISGLQQRMKESKGLDQKAIGILKTQLKEIEAKQQRLFEAVESGMLEIDEHLKRRSHELKAQREALQLELASQGQRQMLPSSYLRTGQAEMFGKIMRQKLLSEAPLSKTYMRMMVDKIVVTKNTATIEGSNASLLGAIAGTEKGEIKQVPIFMGKWCALQGSNLRPSD